MKSHNNVSYYQNLLITKANTNPTYYLASNLNYSVTKKRLIMMTKTASNKQTVVKKVIVLPVLTALIFLLCVKTVAQTTTVKESTVKKEKLITTYYDKTTFKIKDEKGNVAAEKKYDELTPVEKKAIPSMFGDKKTLPTNEEVTSIIEKGGPETIELDIYDPKKIEVKKGVNDIPSVSDVSENPNYPGGIKEFYKFVGQNFQMPKTPSDVKLKGKVYLTFIIEKDGSLSEFKILRDIGYGSGEEAVRVLKLCPNWKPGTVDNKPVRTMYSLPITIEAT